MTDGNLIDRSGHFGGLNCAFRLGKPKKNTAKKAKVTSNKQILHIKNHYANIDMDFGKYSRLPITPVWNISNLFTFS